MSILSIFITVSWGSGALKHSDPSPAFLPMTPTLEGTTRNEKAGNGVAYGFGRQRCPGHLRLESQMGSAFFGQEVFLCQANGDHECIIPVEQGEAFLHLERCP